MTKEERTPGGEPAAQALERAKHLADRLGGLAAGVRLASGKPNLFVARKESVIYVQLHVDAATSMDELVQRLREIVAMHKRVKQRAR